MKHMKRELLVMMLWSTSALFSACADQTEDDLVLSPRYYVYNAEEAWSLIDNYRQSGWHCYAKGDIDDAYFWFTQGAQGVRFKKDYFDVITRTNIPKAYYLQDPYSLYYKGLINFQRMESVKDNGPNYSDAILKDFLAAYKNALFVEVADVAKFRCAVYKAMCKLCGWCIHNNREEEGSILLHRVLDLDLDARESILINAYDQQAAVKIDSHISLPLKEIIINNYDLPTALKRIPIEKGGILVLSTLYFILGNHGKYVENAPEKKLQKTPEAYLALCIILARDIKKKIDSPEAICAAHLLLTKSLCSLFDESYKSGKWLPFVQNIFNESPIHHEQYKALCVVVANDTLREQARNGVDTVTKIKSLLAFLEDQARQETQQQRNYRKLLAHTYILNEIIPTDAAKAVEFGSFVADDDYYLANVIACAYAGRMKDTTLPVYDAFQAQKFYKLAMDLVVQGDRQFAIARLKKSQTYLNPYSFILDARVSLDKGDLREGLDYLEKGLNFKVLPLSIDKALNEEYNKFKAQFLTCTQDKNFIKSLKKIESRHLSKIIKVHN